MTFYSAAITLILVMDPLGNIPVFLAILRKYNAATQRKIIIRESMIAFLILVVFLFFGQYILHGLQITTSALSIAGGVILFLISLRMIFPPPKQPEEVLAHEPFVVPLAVPLTAGPSAIATVLLFATREPTHMMLWFGAITIASAFFLMVMLSSRILMRVLGERGLIATERLMGMLLATVAIQMLLSGLEQYFQHV